MKGRWPTMWVYGAILREAGLSLTDSEVLLRRNNQPPPRVIRGWNDQGLNVMEKVTAARITESLEPMRKHAELVESDRQNRFAAELWKSHALSAKEEANLLNGLRAKVLHALAYVLESHPEKAGEVAKDLRDMARDME